MGCGPSKIESEEAVARCKDRKEFMKKAVSSRNAFAAAHSLYTISLKNTGAALSDYGQGEADLIIIPSSSSSASIPSSSVPAASIVPPVDNPLPPPPPLPDYQPSPLQRAASMPEISIPKKHTRIPPDDVINEDEEDGDADDEEEDDGDDDEHRRHQNTKDGGDVRPIPPPPEPAAAPPQARAQQQQQAQASGARKGAPTPEWLSQYFFDTESIPVPSLSQPEVPIPPPLPREEKDVVTDPTWSAPPPPPAAVKEQEQVKKKKKAAQHQHAASIDSGDGKRGREATRSVNLVQVLDELDEHFLKAMESAHEVSKMLEATRMHYHSNFADNRGHIDHSARLMRVITWNRSCKGLKDDYVGMDDSDNEESETHATILDKMLAWEKKLYDEVKAGELMKIEYQRKVAALNKQKKRGASSETLEKTKAAVGHLHTRYIVDMQSMDSTVSEINRLRDKQLYPKLVDLVDGMAKMWETMFIHHGSQYKIAGALRNLDISVPPKETSEQHHKRTQQLWQVLSDWHSRFQNLIKYQKEYIRALNDWLKLNLIPIESNRKERVSSPPRVIRPAIQPFLIAWHDLLGRLPDERARGAIHTFSEVVNTITIVQSDELKLKEKCEEIRRDYIRKRRAFDDWYQKHLENKAAAAAAAAEVENTAVTDEPGSNEREEENTAVTDEPGSNEREDRDEMVEERRAVLESLMVRLKEEEGEYHRTSKKVREKSIGSLKTHLPELFRALSEFAYECSQMYKKLRSITTETADPSEAR